MTDHGDIEHLLTHADWLTRLARRLVSDAATADDLVQETWIAALRRPPSADRPARPWLSTVVRRLAALRSRKDGSRPEHRSLASDAVPAIDEAAERVEQERALAELVLALEEPYRSTILLRFYREMTATQTARELGIPAATVRTHLRRGLDRLRTRLDKANGGDGRSWLTALAPLYGNDTWLKTTVSMATGGAMTKSLVGVAVAATTVLWWVREHPAEITPPATSETTAVVKTITDARPPLDLPTETAMERVELAPGEATLTGTLAGETGLVVQAIRSDDGTPLEEIRGYVKPSSPTASQSITWPESGRDARLLEYATSDASGTLRFDLPLGKRLELKLSSRSRDIGPLALPIAPLEEGELRSVVAELPVGPDLRYVGRIVDDATGMPLVGAEAFVPEGQSSGGVIEHYAKTTSDADGYFVINGLSWARQHVRIDAPGYGLLLAVLVEGHDSDATAQELRLLEAATLGFRLAGSGSLGTEIEVRATTSFSNLIRPRTGAGDTTGFDPRWATTMGVDGYAELAGLPPGVPISLELWRDGKLVRPVSPAPRLAPGEKRIVEITVGDGARIVGVARTPQGAPIGDLSVVLRDSESETRGRYLDRWDNQKAVQKVTTDQDGRFVFTDVPPGKWLVGPACLREPGDPFDATHPPPLASLVRIEETTREEHVRLEVGPSLSIRGRVVDAAGAPGAKLWVRLDSDQLDGVQDFLTGVDGRFTAGPLTPGHFSLVALGRGQSTNSAPIRAEAGTADEVLLRLKPAAEIRGRVVDSQSGEGRSAELRLISAEDLSGYVRWENSSREGYFSLGSLAPGTYHLLARSDDGRIALLRDLAIRGSASLEGVEVRLEPGAIVVLSDPTATEERCVTLLHNGLHAGHGFVGPAKISEQVLFPGRTTILYLRPGAAAEEFEVDLLVGERRKLALGKSSRSRQ